MKDILERRARIVRAIRTFFDSRDFIEVETPVRIDAPAPEEFIDCPPVVGGGFLRASPELQMKKLLAQGLDRIYQIGPCFREGEHGERHNPEFTMIEWYRRDATYLDIMEDMKLLFFELLNTPTPQAPGTRSVFRDSCFVIRETRTTNHEPRTRHQAPTSQLRILRVRDAYREYAGWDPWTDWDHDRFDLDMANVVEPALKRIGGGVFLTDYPVQVASLAKIRGDVAERWEFYWNGMELANCFTELCDGEEQTRRFRLAKARRKELGEADYPIDEEFLAAVPLMRSAAGVALGVDRLVMVLTGLDRIDRVRVGC